MLLSVIAVTSLSAKQPEGGETQVRVAIPKAVSAYARARLSGETRAQPPILVLEGLELGQNEGLTIRVLGPTEPSSAKTGQVLGVVGTVGHKQHRPVAPLRKMTLLVPLNDRALAVLADNSEVTLTLIVENNPSRPPIKAERVYFRAEE